jgi:hypothetical protein
MLMKRWAIQAVLLAVFASAASAEDAKEEPPQIIKVQLVMVNLGRLDMSTGGFTADFYLVLKSDRPIPVMPQKKDQPTIEFQNGRGTIEWVEEINSEQDPANKKYETTYRVLANLTTPIDLKRYPFDAQKLQIIMEDKQKTMEKLKFVALPDESGLDDAIQTQFPGWTVKGWDVAVGDHYYKQFDQHYSQYIFSIDIKRVLLSSFLKTFLPVVFIMLVVLSSFILDLDKLTTRLAMVSSGLVASVMFHVSITGQIPPVGYLTFADKFMVLTYFILLVSFFINAYILLLLGKKKDAVALKLHHATEYSMFGIVPVLYVALFLLLI